MADSQPNEMLDAMSIGVRAVNKVTNANAESDEKLTPELLANAIKMASLSSDHQEQLTPATVSAALKLASKTSTTDSQQQQPEQQAELTPASLAAALKVATKASKPTSPGSTDNKNTGGASADKMLAAMKAAVAMTQEDQAAEETVTPDIIAAALKLVNK